MSDLKTIDRYEIRQVLGKGAMGSVYAAWDPKLHREVAIKLVSSELTQDDKARERFGREARAIAALRHPNIVEIYDYSGTDSEHLYLVMEKLDGDDLFNIINDKGITPEPCAAAIGHELCLALQVAHEAGIIHRDMKPENVFLNSAGRVVLTDFGVVKAIREDSAVDGFAQKTDVIGTPGFMAPELMMNRALGPRTDIFALGALLYNISTGELPFDGASPVEMFRAVVASQYTDPRRYNSLLSEEFCAMLDGCLQAKPKKRFRSAEQLREALKNILELNGASDLRDDLRDYMRDPVGYGHLWRRRTTNYLLQRLKVALKDKDEAQANMIRERLKIVDPDNREIQAISGFFVTESGRISVKPSRSSSGSEAPPRLAVRWLYLAAGVLTGVAIILAGFAVFRAKPKVSTPGDPVIVQPVEFNQDTDDPVLSQQAVGQVTITVKGSAYKLSIDGKQISKLPRGPLALSVGDHDIEIRTRKKRLKERVTVSEDKMTNVLFDLRRNRVTVK